MTSNLLIAMAVNRDVSTLHHLLQQGADVNESNSHGFTALQAVCVEGHLDILSFLLPWPGLDVNLPNCNGNTPLIHATTHNHAPLVQQLVWHSSLRVNQPNFQSGWTALHHASHRGLVRVVQILLQHAQIQVNCRTFHPQAPQTPLDMALQRGHKSVEELLLQHGAKIAAQLPRQEIPPANARMPSSVRAPTPQMRSRSAAAAVHAPPPPRPVAPPQQQQQPPPAALTRNYYAPPPPPVQLAPRPAQLTSRAISAPSNNYNNMMRTVSPATSATSSTKASSFATSSMTSHQNKHPHHHTTRAVAPATMTIPPLPNITQPQQQQNKKPSPSSSTEKKSTADYKAANQALREAQQSLEQRIAKLETELNEVVHTLPP